jgi:hypothetical protein
LRVKTASPGPCPIFLARDVQLDPVRGHRFRRDLCVAFDFNLVNEKMPRDVVRKATEIGERIRTFMRRKNLSQNALGKVLGITGNGVAQMLSGQGTVHRL